MVQTRSAYIFVGKIKEYTEGLTGPKNNFEI